jgi:hypothetical protein
MAYLVAWGIQESTVFILKYWYTKVVAKFASWANMAKLQG